MLAFYKAVKYACRKRYDTLKSYLIFQRSLHGIPGGECKKCLLNLLFRSRYDLILEAEIQIREIGTVAGDPNNKR